MTIERPMFPPPRRGAVVAFPAAALPRHPSPPTVPSALPRPAKSPLAGFILPVPELLAKDYFVPKGMGPRQHQKLFWRVLRSPERSAFCQAMDRAYAAKKELEIATGEQHRILFAAMLRHFPDMARRVLARAHATTARQIVVGLQGRQS
jgi:hypothetical protein